MLNCCMMQLLHDATAACLVRRAVTQLQCHSRLFSLPKCMWRLLHAEDNVLSLQRPPQMHVGKGIL